MTEDWSELGHHGPKDRDRVGPGAVPRNIADTIHTEQFDVRNRWTNAVQFTAEITCAPDATYSVKLGLAVKWAVNARANLTDANLADANLAGANLADAYLTGANLTDANLAGANLTRAYLARANLAGANLADANFAGAKIGTDTIDRVIAIAHRLDGYAFAAFKLDTGAVKIKAGCRYFTPAEFREHVAQSYPDTPKAVETLSIIEHIERMASLFSEEKS